MCLCVCVHNTAVTDNTSAFPGMYSELFVCLFSSSFREQKHPSPLPCKKGACNKEQRIDIPQGTEAGGSRHRPCNRQAATVLMPYGAYLIYVDGQSNEDVEKVSERQASNEDIWPIPHALVLVNDPQERGVPDDPYYEDGAGHDGVDVLEDVSDICRLHAHGQQGWLGAGAPGEALRVV